MAKVCIDAGHYGRYNRCPGNEKYYESEVMWKLHLLKKKYLEQLGVEVVTTREELDKDLALKTRGMKAEGCDLFESLHSNAASNYMNEDIDHVAVYRLTDDTTTECDDISKEYAEKIAAVVAEVMGVDYKVLQRKESYDRNGDGILNDNYYGVLHGARLVNVPGVIIEHSFHTNTKTVEWLLNDDNLDKLARAEAECTASFVLKKKVSLDDLKKDDRILYRVQVGAYSKMTYAQNQLVAVKEAGFTDAFITQADNLFKVQVGAFSKKAYADNMLEKVKAAGFDAFITTKSGKAAAPVVEESKYYEKYTGSDYRIDVIFKEIGVPEKYRGSYMKRKPIALANGLSNNYKGLYADNCKLINLAKEGQLRKPI